MSRRRFVDAVWVRSRMNMTDARYEHELRLRQPSIFPPEVLPFVEVTIIRAPDAAGLVEDVGLEPAPTLAENCDHCLCGTGEIVDLVAGVCPVCRRDGAQ